MCRKFSCFAWNGSYTERHRPALKRLGERMQFTDRYKALGIPYPNPKTMCHGDCEGTGYYPTKGDDPHDRELWCSAHFLWRLKAIRSIFRHPEWWVVKSVLRDIFKPHDGWHFIKCPRCNGTGLSGEIGG